MHLIFSVLAAACIGLAAAQDYPLQTDPFHLKLESDNETWDGQYLASYHSGAAIEQLAPAGTDVPTSTSREYFLNYTTDCATNEVEGNKVGILTWNLLANNGELVVSSGLGFFPNETSEVVMLAFFPGPPEADTPPLGFDEEDEMFVYVDDAVSRDWFVCSTFFGGYNYNALTWIEGGGAGESVHPSCSAVSVIREFVEE